MLPTMEEDSAVVGLEGSKTDEEEVVVVVEEEEEA